MLAPAPPIRAALLRYASRAPPPQINKSATHNFPSLSLSQSELDEYALPLDNNEQKNDDRQTGKSLSRIDEKSAMNRSKKGGSRMENNNHDEELFEQHESRVSEEGENEEFTYQGLLMKILNPDQAKEKDAGPVTTKIQNALFVDATVQSTLNGIKTGEDAISFFAKYGNTTPIKFINCIRNEKPGSIDFRPYDLIKTRHGESQKELALDEYYTISANGIVHVWTEKGKKKAEGDTSTEVISLSDWMHESTMFNIIRNIQFFKNYVIAKVFNLWKANVHYRIFCRTRKRLIHDSFIAKPAFAHHLLDINKHMHDLQTHTTISSQISVIKTWEIE